MGISSKCFEILENKPSSYDARTSSDPHSSTNAPLHDASEPLHINSSDDDEEGEDVDDEDEEDNEDGDVTEIGGAEGEDIGSETDTDEIHDDDDDDDDNSVYDNEEGRRMPRLRLREILFYDDKVAVFKARHGRL